MAVVNRVPVYICINYFFVLTVEKAQVRRKIALASVHRLAEHVQAMSTQKSRYKISDYIVGDSQTSALPIFPQGGGRYTGYPTQMFLICRKSCNTLYTWLHPVRCEKCNSCTLYCQLPLILMITVTKIMMMVKIMRKKTIYSRSSVTRTKSRFPSFCRRGEGKKEGGGDFFKRSIGGSAV